MIKKYKFITYILFILLVGCGYNSVLNDNSSNYYKNRVLKTKKINSRSSINHFAFHLANPINVFFRNIFLKYLSKNKNFLENYLGKIYKS